MKIQLNEMPLQIQIMILDEKASFALMGGLFLRDTAGLSLLQAKQAQSNQVSFLSTTVGLDTN